MKTMCEWGTSVQMPINGRVVNIDSCIAHIVAALNAGGVLTKACCCGHGKRPGSIILADGRELMIAPDYETGRAIDKAFPPIFDPDGGSCPACGGPVDNDGSTSCNEKGD
jgi:hypothetical protein